MLLWVLFAFTKQMFLNIYVMKKMQAFEKLSKNNFLFSIWVFATYTTAGEGGGYFYNFSLALPPASQTLSH